MALALLTALFSPSSGLPDAGEQECAFEHELPSTVQVMGLTQDWNAYSGDDCKANCCSDTENKCTVYQFQQGGHSYTCMRGDSTQTQDSGGQVWTGETGRSSGGGGGSGSGANGDGGSLDAALQAMDTFALCVVGVMLVYAGIVSVRGRTRYDRQLESLVVDGWHFFMFNRKGTPYEPLPESPAQVTGVPWETVSARRAVARDSAAAGAVDMSRRPSWQGGAAGSGRPVVPRQKLRKKKFPTPTSPRAGVDTGAGGPDPEEGVSETPSASGEPSGGSSLRGLRSVREAAKSGQVLGQE